MPALKPTNHIGEITWLGVVPHRDSREIETLPRTSLELGFAGPLDDVHSGLTRPACVRVAAQYTKGDEIRNTRQVSIVSEEELAIIAEKLGMDHIDPLWLGATIVVKGIADFSHIPPSARLQFESGATLTVDMQNRPCGFVRDTIAAHRPGEGADFVRAASKRRGITAWVEREGSVQIGHKVRLHVPDQRAWAP